MKSPRNKTKQAAFDARSLKLSRRTVLRGAGVALALPALECMAAAPGAQRESPEPRRMVAINMGLSFHPPHLMPVKAGREYETTRYLKALADLRDDYTIISGTSHPQVDGGHAAYHSWLSAAPHTGTANFQNSISIDQLAAKAIGLQTRFASMTIGTGISVSTNGVNVPGSPYPSHHFRRMFVEGKPNEKAAQVERLREGRSVLDTVLGNANRMRARIGRNDQRKIDEYFNAVREAEQRLQKSQQWEAKAKPKVDATLPVDIRDQSSIIQQARQMYDVMFLAIQTDSTRLITYMISDSTVVPKLPGVSRGYHDLSHSGKDPEKLQQLAIVEEEYVKVHGEFIRRLKETKEGDSNLLDRTMVLLGSHMHSGQHNNRNLPILLAGGRFRHGQHLAFSPTNNVPLANVYVSMLQNLGLEVETFASSTSTLTGLNAV